ncbi:MAG: DUF1444 family protein [Lysobacter sp.]|nr:DUF1444 family protein [Lysobacter sp.]
MTGFFAAVRSLFGGGAAEPRMNPADFTEEVARRVRAAAPRLDVRVVGELELAIDMSEDGGNRAFLNNAYQMYQGESARNRSDLIDRFVRSFAEAAAGLERSRDAIIPIVKDRGWLEEIRQSMRQMHGTEGQDKVYEDLNDDLVVVYAIDTPSNIAYLNPDELERLDVPREDLRALAVRNLRGLLPGIEVHRGDLVNMITADGNYEASLLLFADLWEREREKLRGEPVAAVPARDLLLFADSANADAVAQLKQLASKMRAEATYALTGRLFVLRDGHWLPF